MSFNEFLNVYRIEEAVIRTLLYFGVTGHRVAGAPGIYVRLDDPAGHTPLPQRPQKGASAAPDFTGLGKIGERMLILLDINRLLAGTESKLGSKK